MTQHVADEQIGLSPAHFEALFPFFFAFDRELRITALGTTLQKKVSELNLGKAVSECFVIKRPTSDLVLADILAKPTTLYVVECRETPLVLRGQILQHAEDRFLFLGSPWFSDTEEMTVAGLTFDDFATHDPAIDLLQLIQTQKIAFQDIKAFTDRLKQQKEKLSNANHELERQNQILQTTEVRLRQKEAETRKLALVAAGTDNAVIITDANGLTEWVNEGFRKQTGYTLEDIEGKKPGSLLQGVDTDPKTVEFMRKQIDAGESFQVEILNYTKTLEPHWVEIEIQPVRDSDQNITNFIAIESDITDRKQVESSLREAKQSAEEASRLKSEFLATVSHEIRTPMNGILGMSELLLESGLNPRQLGLLQTICASADSLLAVINDVLDLSKIESGRLESHNETFSLRSLIDTVLGATGERCAQKSVNLNAVVDANLPDCLLGDRSKLRQVLINLVGNAAKFTEQGEIRLTVQELSRFGKTCNLEFRVKDTGIGFDSSEAEKLFESFRQSDSSLARKHGGTGLGLSISKKLVEFLGGSITASGKLHEGAEFICRLPLTLSSTEPDVPSELDGLNSLQVCLENLQTSTALAAAQHLRHLDIPHRITSSDLDSSEFFSQAKQEPDQKQVVIRDESTVDGGRPIASESTESITLVSVASSYDASPAEHVLIKPLRFNNLRKLLTAIETGTDVELPAVAGLDAGSSTPRFRSILVAEDNSINRRLIIEVLQRLNLKATIVQNGQEVLDSIAQHDYDCILMDCQMPELDGLETTRRIRIQEASQGNGNSDRIHIIAMTANALVGDREKCLQAGMDDYLAKPIRFADLREKLLLRLPQNKMENREAVPSQEESPSSEIQQAIKRLEEDLGAEAVKILTDELLEDLPQRVAKMESLNPSTELDTIKLESHSLKSLCQTYGMTTTGEEAQELEILATNGESIDKVTSQLQVVTDSFETDLEHLRRALETNG